MWRTDGHVYPVVCGQQQELTAPQMLQAFSLTDEMGVWSLTSMWHVAYYVDMCTFLLKENRFLNQTLLALSTNPYKSQVSQLVTYEITDGQTEKNLS